MKIFWCMKKSLSAEKQTRSPASEPNSLTTLQTANFFGRHTYVFAALVSVLAEQKKAKGPFWKMKKFPKNIGNKNSRATKFVTFIFFSISILGINVILCLHVKSVKDAFIGFFYHYIFCFRV